MNQEKQGSLVTLGITSLFLIFAVLCLVILSLLTLGTSQADLQMSRQSMESTAAYYDACREASLQYLKLEEELQEFSGTTHSTRELLEAANSLNLDGVSADFRTGHLILELPFSENQSLLAELSPNIADSGQELHLEILSWQTISTGTWNPDTKQPVLNAKENTL